jgi:hypothetical protein
MKHKCRRRFFWAGLLLLPFVFLFTQLPTPKPGTICLTHITIAETASFLHMCDSSSITAEMRNLENYFTEMNPWRSRPVYILVGTALGAALNPVATLIRVTFLQHRLSGTADIAEFMRRFPDYFALNIINFVVLAVTLWLGFTFIGERDELLSVALGAAISTSDLVQGYIWSQHPAFFSLIIPFGCIAYFIAGCRVRQMSTTAIIGFGLAAGFSMLIYGLAVVWLPMFVFGALYRDLRMGAQLAEIVADLLWPGALLAITGCGPVLLWLAFNTYYLKLSTFYEADTNQFVWLSNAWRAGELSRVLRDHWHGYLDRVLGWLGWPAPAALLCAALLLFADFRKFSPAQIVRDPVLVAVALTILCILTFNFFQGADAARLVNGIVLVLFLALARVAQQTGRAMVGTAVLSVIGLAQVGYAFIQPALTVQY